MAIACRVASATSCSRREMKNGSGRTKSAPACRWTAAKAGSNSASVPAVITWSCRPTARAVSCISVVLITVFGLFGFTRKATVAAVGTSSQSSSSCFAISVKDNRLTPITLPPGRLRLATRPSFMGSLPVSKTIGMVRVAALAASAEGSPPVAAITTTCRLIKSATSAGNRSYFPSAQRYSIATFWPST